MAKHLLAVLACPLLLAACGSVRVERQVAASGIDPLHRIFVIDRIGPARHEIPASFAASLHARLAACGVDAKVVHREGLELDGDPDTIAELRAAKPDAVLQIRLERALSVVSYEGVFLFTLVSAASGRDLWKASVRILAGGNPTLNTEVGTRLGTEIVRLWAANGVLRSCPGAPA